ncbi:MAG: two-component regulator propeller domain-containing protein, partial [Ginsengibacter sp.]
MKNRFLRHIQFYNSSFIRIGWLYLLCIASLLSGSLLVCSQKISFTTVAPPKESPFTLVTGITQDALGYMWFTSGPVLYRYNGYEFITYKNNLLNPNSISNFNLDCVYADKSGLIWVGSSGAGLIRLDSRTGIFKHYRHNKSDALSIINDWVNTITEDHEGYIWVGTPEGLNRLDKQTGRFTRYVNDPEDQTSLSEDYVGVVYEDQSGTIWVGTGDAFSINQVRNRVSNKIRNREGGGLNRFDRKTGKFTRYLHNPKDPHSLIDNRVGAICEDSHGVFWVGTAGDGLHS